MITERELRPFGPGKTDEELPDNDIDMGLHFDPRLAGITLHDTEACVRGRYTAPDGTNLGFLGCDKITVVPNSHSVFLLQCRVGPDRLDTVCT